MLHSYPEVYQLGHKLVSNVLNGHVLVEEKVDGSQISFGLDEHLKLRMRSKNKEIDIDNPDGSVELSLVWENDSTYLLDLVARVIFGDCNDIDGYFRITKSDVYSLRMNILEEFHSANERLKVYIDADSDIISLLRLMEGGCKYVVRIE